MNERIKLLADEARIKFSSHWAHQGVDTAVITRRDLKEFAELIVRECADIAKHHVMNISTYGDAEFVDEQIQEHFGVEE